MDRKPVLLGWQLADTFGWGIAGLNIFREWAFGTEIAPLSAIPIAGRLMQDSDPAKARQLEIAAATSNQLAARIAAQKGSALTLGLPTIVALGNQLHPALDITGTRTVGRVAFEHTRLDGVAEKLKDYDAFTCVSEWNAGLLRALSGPPVSVNHEAIDHHLFSPGPRAGLLPPNRFHIFTGGKVEFRKAQDLVLLAFRAFSRRHDDAVLVTAWHSHWPQLSVGFKGRLDAPLHHDAGGKLDIKRWAAENGIDPLKVMDLGLIPNAMMPRYLREMDCALQPSRAEGGTNIVAMEAMGCGLPVIIARNTGMLDLVADQSCIPLVRQGKVEDKDGLGTEGWGESDVDEIVEALERLYVDRALRAEVGAEAAVAIRKWSWAEHARKLAALAL